MTSTQEQKTMAPQSALCICSRKWNPKLSYRSGHGGLECDSVLLILVHLACLVFECRGAPGREASGFLLEFEPGIDVTGKDTR